MESLYCRIHRNALRSAHRSYCGRRGLISAAHRKPSQCYSPALRWMRRDITASHRMSRSAVVLSAHSLQQKYPSIHWFVTGQPISSCGALAPLSRNELEHVTSYSWRSNRDRLPQTRSPRCISCISTYSSIIESLGSPANFRV